MTQLVVRDSECEAEAFVIAGSYSIYFLASVFLSFLFTRWVRAYATAHGWVSKPASDRHVHTKSVPRLGGVAICGSFVAVAAVAMLVPRPWGLHVSLPVYTVASIGGSALIIFLLGLYDDIKGLGAYPKFAIQVVAAILLYVGGVGVQRLDLFSAGHSLRTVIGLPLTVVWVLLVTNAFNLIDGLDGLAAGSAFFSTIVLLVMSLFVPHYSVTVLTIALAGAILGFLPFNFHPASIFLGDSGSMFIGFMLSALALAGSQKAPTMIAVAIPVLSCGLPILDVALAVSRRFLGGRPLFSADRDHIHHKLLKRGLSQRGAVLVLYAVTSVFAILSLIVLHDAATIAFVLIVVGLGIALGVQYLGYAEFSELRRLLQRSSFQRRKVANNVEVRHAIESLNSCTDINLLCKILKTTLQSIGFDGFRLGYSSSDVFFDAIPSSLKHTDDGEIQLLWQDLRTSEASCELRLDLVAENRRCVGYCGLMRLGRANPLLVDINLLTCDFQDALSRAMARIASDSEAFLPSSAAKQTVRAKAASVSD